MRNKSVLNSPRLRVLRKKRRQDAWNKFLIYFAGFLLIFFGLAYVSRAKGLNISEIAVSGNKVVDTEAITATVNSLLAGKYLWLFPKTNVLYYPEGKLRQILTEKFTRLKAMNFSVSRNKLTVSVSERVPKYTWCGENFTASDSTCYFMDDDGYIFDLAPKFSGDVYFKFYGKTTSAGGEILGSTYYSADFRQLIAFKDTLTALGMKPTTINIKDDGDAEIFLVKGGSAATTPKILFRMGDDYTKLAENLETALSTDPLQTKWKTKYSKLEYIDLRFQNKVYDKFD